MATTSPTSEYSSSQLLARIRSLRHRALLLGVLSGIGWGLLAAAGILFVAAWLDLIWDLSAALRLFSVRGALLAGLGVVAWVVWLVSKQAGNAHIARRLDSAATGGGSIASGVDLASTPDDGGSSLRRGLVSMAIERATKLVASVPGSRVVPLRPAGVAWASVLVLFALCVMGALLFPKLAYTQWLRFATPLDDHPPFTQLRFDIEPGDARIVYGEPLDIYAVASGAPVEQLQLVLADPSSGERIDELPMFQESSGRWRAALSRITQPAEYFVVAGRARSPRYSIDLITVPRIEAVRFRVTPPAYTGRSAYEGPLPPVGLEGLPGTRVDVWATSNRPLSGGDLTIETAGDNQRVSLATAAKANQVTGSFEIRASGKFRLYVRDTDLQTSQDAVSGAVTLLDDHRPFVRLLKPKLVSLATPTAIVPVEMVAEDDYGISSLQLFRSLNKSRALPLAIGVSRQLTRLHEGVELPFASYGLSPGDESKLYARGEDNEPEGAKGSESEIATIRIVSEEDFQQMLRRKQGLQVLTSKYREVQRRLASLAEEKKGLLKKLEEQGNRPISEDLKKAFEDLHRRQQAEIDTLRKLQKRVVPYDLDKKLQQQLADLVKRLERQAEQSGKLAELASEPGASAEDLAETLELLLADLEDERRAFDEQIMQPMESLEDVFPLIEDQARFAALVQRQRSLANRLKSLDGHGGEDDPALKRRMRDLEAEQRALRQQLSDLLDDIDNHIQRLPQDAEFDEFRQSAVDFVDAVRRSGASEAMAEAELGLAEFSGTRGYEKADEAADILEKFLSKCEGMVGQGMQLCRLQFQPGACDPVPTLAQLLGELGLLPGMGQGQGQGGYSARRHTMANMGLYGQQPLSAAPRGGAGSDDQPTAGGNVGGEAYNRGTMDGRQDWENTGAVGGSAESVPPQYRRRVAEYFRRLAEELSER